MKEVKRIRNEGRGGRNDCERRGEDAKDKMELLCLVTGYERSSPLVFDEQRNLCCSALPAPFTYPIHKVILPKSHETMTIHILNLSTSHKFSQIGRAHV